MPLPPRANARFDPHSEELSVVPVEGALIMDGPAVGGTGEAQMMLHTFSIAGRCERSGQLGVAVSTADVAAGRLVTWARANVGAIATQSWPNLYQGIDGLRLLAAGNNAGDVMRELLEGDPGRDVRQIGIVDARGRSATWSGAQCEPWYGGVNGDGFAAQGNMLTGERTVTAMAETFERRTDLDLVERLLSALEAGQAAGGDKRGRQSAAVLVVEAEEYPLWDLRADEHPRPVAELRRIYEIAKLDLLPLVSGLPTRQNPLGSVDEEFVATDMKPPPDRPGHGGAGPVPEGERVL